MATMKKLDTFWRHSNCDTAIQIHVADAVLRSKLLYGLESAQLIPSIAKKLDTFQLKVLRKILRMDTTYIDRANTNTVVINKANTTMENEGRKKKVIPFSEAYIKFKRKLACKIITKTASPAHKVTFINQKLRKWIHHGRRVGRPRLNWAEETIKELWDYLKKDTDRFKYTAFDDSNEEIMETLKTYAAQNH